MQTATVHVGLPKCGSTAFQQSLEAAQGRLGQNGIHVLTHNNFGSSAGQTTRALNLATAVIRPELDAWFRVVVPETQLTSFIRECEASVQRQSATPEVHLVASMEDLCLIRTDAEVEQLRHLLMPREVSAVLVLRDKATYRRSLKYQLAKAGLRTWSPVPDSCFNTTEGSWLFEHATLARVLRDVLGPDAVTILDYDAVVASEGSIVPALWRACGLPEEVLTEVGWQQRWTNVSSDLEAWDIEAEDSLEALRDYAWRLKADNDRMRQSAAWRLTRPLGRMRSGLSARWWRR